jgi:hypothetical protein
MRLKGKFENFDQLASAADIRVRAPDPRRPPSKGSMYYLVFFFIFAVSLFNTPPGLS